MKKELFTRYQIKLDSSQKGKALSLLMANSLSYLQAKNIDENFFIITIKGKDKKIFENILSSNGINAEFIEIKGLLSPIFELKTRVGLIIGLLFLLLSLSFSSKIVWKIEVLGNTVSSTEEIIEELKDAGFNEGTYIPEINYDELQNRILLNSKRLSWISINITGNVAKVFIKEKSSENQKTEPKYSNIVAKYDGYIESIRVINGKKVAAIGQIVKKGDVLISGIIDSQSQGIRYEEAKGEIIAYVNKKIKIEIPYKSTEKIYTGVRHVYKDYKIFNFYTNFSSKYGNQTVFYDKIEKREKFSVFGIKTLPLEVIKTTLYEYKYAQKKLSKQEAIDKAFSNLRAEMDIALENAELISKVINTSFDENGFYIDCQLYCLEDIAKIQEFYVSN